MKKFLALLLALVMALSLVACGETAPAPAADDGAEANEGPAYHIGIVTGSVSQSEDDRRGAEAFQAK